MTWFVVSAVVGVVVALVVYYAVKGHNKKVEDRRHLYDSQMRMQPWYPYPAPQYPVPPAPQAQQYPMPPAPQAQQYPMPTVPAATGSVIEGAFFALMQRGSTGKTRQFFGSNCRYWEVKDSDILSHPRVFGKPGCGLNASGFGKDRVEAGQKGEMNLAKLFYKTGLLDLPNVYTFWSLYLPGTGLDVDVDCAVLVGNTILLVDAKMYKSNAKYIYTGDGRGQLTCTDTTTGNVVKTYQLSRSMPMARDKYAEYFTSESIIPVVALCPGSGGNAAVGQNVTGVEGTRVFQAYDLAETLKVALGKNNTPVNPEVVEKMKGLLKGIPANEAAHARNK